MTSRLLSRILSQSNSPSIYETLRAHDQDPDDEADIEERAGMLADEDNLRSHHGELHSAMLSAMASRSDLDELETASSRFVGDRRESPHDTRRRVEMPELAEMDQVNDEVPHSLLVEASRGESPIATRKPLHGGIPSPIVGQPNGNDRRERATEQPRNRFYQDTSIRSAYTGRPTGKNPLFMTDPKEKAMWRWANVQNLDEYLGQIYMYYVGKGIYSIVLRRFLHLLEGAFVVSFATFLTQCIDYSKIRHSTTMDQILIPRCMANASSFSNIVLWFATMVWLYKLFEQIVDFRRLKHLHDFYHYVLEIPDADIQTVTWQEVVRGLMNLRDSNPVTATNIRESNRLYMHEEAASRHGISTQRMDAHDIANRLMRRDNYMIALINKDVLDLTLPVSPFRNRIIFSMALQWLLSASIMHFVFGASGGQVNPEFLKASNRATFSRMLASRFRVIGLVALFLAPFTIFYSIVLYFFQHFTEFYKSPSSISEREYTLFAEWRFREFNELPHLFEKRVKMSKPMAARYVNQFPKEKTVLFARFLGLIAGSLAAVLAIVTSLDPELFLNFQITPDRTVIFYLGIFIAIWTVARGAEGEENVVFDPELALRMTAEHTHYLPTHWEGRLHSDDVRQEFAQLYRMKVLNFLEELLGTLTAPLVLMFSLADCSDRIIDFFREFTVHVDGLGYVCSFAVFDFQKGGEDPAKQQRRAFGRHVAQDPRDDYYSTKDGKMLASYYNFMDVYGNEPAGAGEYNARLRQQFHLPPTFPGLATSTALAESQHPLMGRSYRGDRKSKAPVRPIQRASRFAPVDSGIASVLLDPQHQPSTSVVTRPLAQSRLGKSVHRPHPIVEHDEDEMPPQDLLSEGMGTGGRAVEQSVMGLGGEGWKTGRVADAAGDGSGEDERDEGKADKGPGVLGLVYQFSKAKANANTEGMGLGI